MNGFFGGIGGAGHFFQQAYRAGKTEAQRRQQAFEQAYRAQSGPAPEKKEPQTQAEWIAEMRRLEFEHKLAHAKEAEWSSIPTSTKS